MKFVWRVLCVVFTLSSSVCWATSNGFYSVIGTVDYKKHQLVLAKYDGIITKFHVSSGSEIEKDQVLVELEPLLPGLIKQSISLPLEGYKVTQVNSREGDKVSQFQEIMRLSNEQDLIVKAYLYPPKSAKVQLGQKANVFLSPDNPIAPIQGNIIAIHDSSRIQGELPHKMVELEVNTNSCLKSKECSQALLPGSVVKVQLKL